MTAAGGPFSVYMIGGCGAFGRNCAVLEQDGDAVMVDCGSQFPSEASFDVSCMIPHPEHLWDHVPRPLAYVLTHGHEDHIGALHHLLAVAPAPVYGTPFTLGLIADRYETLPPRVRKACPRIELVPGGRVVLSETIAFTPLSVAHSIPQSVALLFEFPAGPVLHTGDFKLAGDAAWRLDPPRLAELAGAPLFLMLADSTGACTAEATAEEAHLAGRIDELIAEAPGRVFVTVFSSHIERIRSFLQVGQRHKRSGAALGRSMERYTACARGLELLPEWNLTTLDEVMALPPGRQMFFISGSQGETSSAMDRLSAGAHPRLKPGPGDTVIFSVSTIPGRELPVSQMIDRFLAAGTTVRMHTAELPTHVSGHGSAAELVRLFEALQPQTVIPVHGSPRYLLAGRALALAAGVPESFLCMEGHRAVFADDSWQVEPLPIDEVLHLENPQDTPICAESLRQRRRMAICGVAFVSCALDRRGRPKAPLQITLSGIGRVKDHPALTEACARAILSSAAEFGDDPPERGIELAVRRFFKSETGKKPQVVVHLNS